jgi:hypothetical protein
MERYIKYKRIEKDVDVCDFEDFFNELIIDGWEIINYTEKKCDCTTNINIIRVIVLVGKRQSNIL